MEMPYKDDYMPIIHAPESGRTVIYDSWKWFLNGDIFQDYYKPKTSITSSQRDDVVATARELATNRIGYKLTSQSDYDSTSSYIGSHKITALRCDGVVEYSYE